MPSDNTAALALAALALAGVVGYVVGRQSVADRTATWRRAAEAEERRVAALAVRVCGRSPAPRSSPGRSERVAAAGRRMER